MVAAPLVQALHSLHQHLQHSGHQVIVDGQASGGGGGDGWNGKIIKGIGLNVLMFGLYILLSDGGGGFFGGGGDGGGGGG